VIYSEDLLQRLAEIRPEVWVGVLYRHMFGTYSPHKENTVGARWNPPEVAAIYTSLESSTAESEGDYRIGMEPLKPKAERRIHRVKVVLASVLDLRDWRLLESLGIDEPSYSMPEPPSCQEVGGAVAHLGHDGILVPSARSKGSNLVIYPDNRGKTYEFIPVDFATVT
jgi:RES domain-containing protein